MRTVKIHKMGSKHQWFIQTWKLDHLKQKKHGGIQFWRQIPSSSCKIHRKCLKTHSEAGKFSKEKNWVKKSKIANLPKRALPKFRADRAPHDLKFDCLVPSWPPLIFCCLLSELQCLITGRNRTFRSAKPKLQNKRNNQAYRHET